ncbi:glycoside hydrolase family 30 protein [Flavobacterium jejuense]|uniref:Glycoside hydrolase family 30 protein n=1 Tax=Flavobacterium jejuense TaxID=1544455 RepID=A0ABX0IRH8_9FLAO|nr:glycoside hydrolase family 30 protein [Flavobacterium jejuense]NHN24731.1 glycoside hydrolase family 30 protein [Flavobacterium jejuense]
MNKIIYIHIFLLILISCNQSEKNSGTINNNVSPEIETKEYKTANVYTTAENTTLRLTVTNSLTFENTNQPLETEIFVTINPEKEFQEFLGIGGAITDASAEVFAKLSPDKQEEFLNAYYSNEGINYNIIRTNINSCDFSTESYTYIKDGDTELNSFDISVDKRFKIPLIKKAADLIKEDLVFYASPWSPPAFMKSNKDMLKGGKLLPKYYDSWAKYYTKFIKAYEKEGLPVWGITLQNEPMATQKWESCIYTAAEERDFLKNHLGPIMEKEGLSEKNIVVWDHNRDLISHRANVIFSDKEAAKYAWGIGFHWYETWTGGEPKFDNVKTVNQSFPTKNLLFTEGCQEEFSQENYQKWSNAERYGNAMINDFNNGTVGWTDWNILLNENGGPNHVQNFCFAPIHADLTKNELIYTPSYYYIGHFSKFIKPNAKRVSTSTSRSTIESTTFKNKDEQLISVVMNKTSEPIDYKIIISNKEINLQIPAHGIQSVLIN